MKKSMECKIAAAISKGDDPPCSLSDLPPVPSFRTTPFLEELCKEFRNSVIKHGDREMSTRMLTLDPIFEDGKTEKEFKDKSSAISPLTTKKSWTI